MSTFENAKPPCTLCGHAVRILDSRMFADGHIHRRHKCVHCGSGFKTVEIKREEYEKMIAQVNDFEKIKQLLTLNKE